MNSESIVIDSLINNEQYIRKVLPYLKEDYFTNLENKLIYNAVRSFFTEYGSVPSAQAVKHIVDSRTDIDENTLKACVEIIDKSSTVAQNMEWLVKTTEQFCKDRALYNAIKASISIVDDPRKEKGVLPQIFSDALAISFDSDLGHDYLDDVEERFEYYNNKENRIPFHIDVLNQATNGGVLRKTLNLWLAGTNVGKAENVNTIIKTPQGYRRFGDLMPGDLVFGSNGRATLVTGTFPQGVQDLYQITFLDGRTVECNLEHLWNVIDNTGAFNRQKTLTVKQMIERISKGKKKNSKMFISLAKPLFYPTRPLDCKVNPYILGLMLGDGCFKNGTFSSADTQLHKAFIETGYQTQKLNLYDYRIYGIRKDLQSIGLNHELSHEKFIPDQYQHSTISDREALLQGLIDTDGHVSNCGNISYSTSSKQLALDIIQLVHGLGGIASINREYIPVYAYKKQKRNGKLHYRVDIRLNTDYVVAARLERKRNLILSKKKKTDKLLIKKIEKIGLAEQMCISVAAQDHLYLTKNCIVTHNTMLLCDIAANYLLSGLNVMYFTLEVSEMEIAKRIDANLVDVGLDEIETIPKELFLRRIAQIRSRASTGRIKIKEYPSSSASILEFEHHLNELKLKENFVPDVICIDYLTITASSRLKPGSVNSYTYYKAVAEELRALNQKFNSIGWSAMQMNRTGFADSDAGLADASDSFGVPMTADWMCAVIETEELVALRQLLFKQEKSRYSNKDNMRRFVTGIDKLKQKMFDVDQTAQDDLMEDKPLMDNTTFGHEDNERGKKRRKGGGAPKGFGGFKF